MTKRELILALQTVGDDDDLEVCLATEEQEVQVIRPIGTVCLQVLNEIYSAVPVDRGLDTLGPRDAQGVQRFNHRALVLYGR